MARITATQSEPTTNGTRITATRPDPDAPDQGEWRPAARESTEAKERAEFLQTWDADGPIGDSGKAKAKQAPAPDDDDDLDDDDDQDELEEDDEVEEAPAPKKVAAKAPAKPAPKVAEPPPDDDSDLDEEEDEDKPAELDDPAIAKGMAKLQKQEQSMRRAFDRERETLNAQIAKDREALRAELAAATEAKQALAAIRARAKLDPMGALEELGIDDLEYVGKQAYLRSKAATDPAHKELAAREQRDRALHGKIADLEKREAERVKADEEAKQLAADREHVTSLIDGIAKQAPKVTKASLTNLALKNDPGFAKSLFAHAHVELQREGVTPTPQQVVLRAEKIQRATLRRYGIDPRTLAAATTSADTTETASKTQAVKATKGKAVRGSDKDLKVPTREELLEEEWSS